MSDYLDRLREERERRERWDRLLAKLLVEERLINALASEAKQAAAKTLQAAGYHRHDRGTWRKKRRGATCVTEAIETIPVTSNEVDPTKAQQRLQEYERAGRTSEKAARSYFNLATDDPKMEGLLIKLCDGNPIRTNEEALIARIEPKDLLRREAIRRRLGQLRRDLAGPDVCSEVEQIIIDRAVLCWLATQDAEARVIRSSDEAPQVFLQKRLDRAQARLLAVLKALDQVRRKTLAGHRLSVKVLGDLTLGGPASTSPLTDPSPPMIEISP